VVQVLLLVKTLIRAGVVSTIKYQSVPEVGARDRDWSHAFFARVARPKPGVRRRRAAILHWGTIEL